MPQPSTSQAARRRRSVALLWIGIAIMVLGIAGAGVWGTTQVLDTIDRVNDFPRMAIPGRTTVSVSEPGKRVIYYVAGDVDFPPRLSISVNGPDGSSLPVSGYELDVRFGVSGTRMGRAIAEFNASEPGKYVVGVQGEAEAGSELAIGDTTGWGLVRGIVGPIVLGAVSFLGGLALIVWAILSRRRPASDRAGYTSKTL